MFLLFESILSPCDPTNTAGWLAEAVSKPAWRTSPNLPVHILSVELQMWGFYALQYVQDGFPRLYFGHDEICGNYVLTRFFYAQESVISHSRDFGGPPLPGLLFPDCPSHHLLGSCPLPLPLGLRSFSGLLLGPLRCNLVKDQVLI